MKPSSPLPPPKNKGNTMLKPFSMSTQSALQNIFKGIVYMEEEEK
jgi:hypothetical protein